MEDQPIFPGLLLYRSSLNGAVKHPASSDRDLQLAAYFLVFLLVWEIRKHYRLDGLTFFVYFAGYGIARFVVDFFCGDPAMFAWEFKQRSCFASQ